MTEVTVHNHESLENYYDKTSNYAITIQPSDKLQFLQKVLSVNKRITSFRQYYRQVFEDDFSNYYFQIEISEPRGNLQKHIGGRLHLHGILMFESKSHIVDYLLKGLRQLLVDSRVTISKIDTIESFNNWWKYIHKQRLLPREFTTLSNYSSMKQYRELTAKRYETETGATG